MSLQVWLPLNGDLRNQGCSDITVTNNGATVDNNGKIGKCYYFNGSSQYLQLNRSLGDIYSNDFSWCIWLKPMDDTRGIIFSEYASSGSSNVAFELLANRTIRVYWNGSPDWTFGLALEKNVWSHVAITKSTNSIKVYINGEFKKENTGTLSARSSTSCIRLGDDYRGGTSVSYMGYMNDARIYDHCLSAAEVKEISQGLVLHYKLDDLTNGIEDSSGYGHHGTITGPITVEDESPRYSSSIYVNGSSYILTPATSFGWYQLDKGTLSCWMKPTASMTGWRGSVGIAADADNNSRGWSLTDYGNVFQVTYGNGSYSLVSSGKTLTQNEWHHCAATIDGTTFKLYFDGELVKTQTITWNSATLNTNARFQVGVDLPGSDEKFIGNYSDVRFYTTVLSDNDILQLYHTGAKIDNKANFHTYEINENGINKLTKTGIIYDNMEESIMTLSDGSHWQLLMFHYVDDGKNLFTSSNANNCNDFGLFSRLKDIDGFKLNNQYEFYAIQDGTAYRWIQTNAPLTTTAVAGFSAVSGYNSPGAGICKCNGNTLLARTNTTSNWWNAFGCYTLYSGGIPGLNQVICKKYLALYARIEKADVKLSNQTVNTSEFIEL